MTLFLSLAIGFVIGLLGAGGSILTVPMLVFVAHHEPREAVLVSLVVVGATSALTALWQLRLGHVRWMPAGLFAVVGVPGTWLGSYVARSWSGRTTLMVFAATLAFAGGATLVARADRTDDKPGPSGVVLLALLAFAVGMVTGTVGAGGGFLIVPALVLVGGLPLRDAIGTSLVVITVNCASGVASKWGSAPLDFRLAATITAVMLAGSAAGSVVAQRVSVASLKRGFGLLLLALAATVGWLAYSGKSATITPHARPATASSPSATP